MSHASNPARSRTSSQTFMPSQLTPEAQKITAVMRSRAKWNLFSKCGMLATKIVLGIATQRSSYSPVYKIVRGQDPHSEVPALTLFSSSQDRVMLPSDFKIPYGFSDYITQLIYVDDPENANKSLDQIRLWQGPDQDSPLAQWRVAVYNSVGFDETLAREPLLYTLTPTHAHSNASLFRLYDDQRWGIDVKRQIKAGEYSTVSFVGPIHVKEDLCALPQLAHHQDHNVAEHDSRLALRQGVFEDRHLDWKCEEYGLGDGTDGKRLQMENVSHMVNGKIQRLSFQETQTIRVEDSLKYDFIEKEKIKLALKRFNLDIDDLDAVAAKFSQATSDKVTSAWDMWIADDPPEPESAATSSEQIRGEAERVSRDLRYATEF